MRHLVFLLGLSLSWALSCSAQDGPALDVTLAPVGDVQRGRLVFGPCRTCHALDAEAGHHNGPNLHQMFGKVAGSQNGYKYYSEAFKAAQFVWTPAFMYAWLEDPMKRFPGSSMMSLGVPDPQARADLIAYLLEASAADPTLGAGALSAGDNN